jgi:sulfoxide reductase catalytic subunit YedY
VPVNEAFSNMVFMAYQVNGETLPVKHGFPLRVVAEGHYGYEWVKYVCRITADSIVSPLS